MLNGRTAGRLATEAMRQAASEPSGYPGVAGLDGDSGLGSCSMEALVTECLQPRDGREEPDPADSGVPDVPRPLLGAAQNSRSALLKGCSSITVGLRTSVRSEATSRRHAGPQLPWHFLYQWSQPGGGLCLQNLAWSGDVFFLVVKAGERGVLPARGAGRAETLLKSPRCTQPPHTAGLCLFPTTTAARWRNPALQSRK